MKLETTDKRVCLRCGKKTKNRKDARFCSHSCRGSHSTEIRRLKNKSMNMIKSNLDIKSDSVIETKIKLIDEHKVWFEKDFKTHLDNKRYTNDTKSKWYVYDNQIDTSIEIIFNYWHSRNHDSGSKRRWVTLCAEMQSGKSGTFFTVPYIIARNPHLDRLGIDKSKDDLNFYLLTGMNDNDLINQLKGDVRSFTGWDCTKNILKNSDMQSLLNRIESDWTDVEKLRVSKMRKNCLFLIDESDFGSDRNQVLNKFLKQVIHITPNGDNACLQENNIYVLSVSATNPAELVNAETTEYKKEKVILKPGIGYYGIEEMFKKEKIKQSCSLGKLQGVNYYLKQILNYKRPGYIITRGSGAQQQKVKDIIDRESLPIEYKDYSQGRKEDINEILEITPKKPTIIFLKQLLRAGKQLESKNNILMVWDTEKSNTDTTAQSLLGRMCGYNPNKNTDIYCDVESAKRYKNWVESGFDLEKTPDKCRNIINRGDGYEVTSIMTPVSKLLDPIRDKEIISLIKGKSKSGERFPDFLRVLKYINLPQINNIISNEEYIKEGGIFNPGKTSIEKQFLQPKSAIKNSKNFFFGDYKPQKDINIEDNLGKKCLHATFYNNEIIVMIGEVRQVMISTKDKSMYSPTNSM